MGLHDREWYQREIEKKGGRPMTFDQKAAASVAKKSQKPAIRYTLHPSNKRTFAPEKQWSPTILGIATIILLVIATIILISIFGIPSLTPRNF